MTLQPPALQSPAAVTAWLPMRSSSEWTVDEFRKSWSSGQVRFQQQVEIQGLTLVLHR